jgi:copper chaperone CopZ
MEMVGTVIVILILLLIAFFAVRSSLTHFRGEGGCCGGGSVPKQAKKLDGKKIAEKLVHIEGMHCENCKNTVEKKLNEIDGAAAKVSLKKKQAVVAMSRMISDEELKAAVEEADFQVTGIELK